jgi:nucleoid-associated protein YgaU
MEKLTIHTLNPDGNWDKQPPIVASFSPPDISFTKASQFAEVAIPGLEQPLLQFVRGDAETLTLDLFFDGTSAAVGEIPVNVATVVGKLAKLVSVNGVHHMPPLVRISWGDGFPGNVIGHKSHDRQPFTAVVLSVTRKYTLFDADGAPLRATANISLKRHATLQEQIDNIGYQSADHTREHIVIEGESLPLIAHDAFGDARLWRIIAEHNKLADASDLKPGMRLELPPMVA